MPPSIFSWVRTRHLAVTAALYLPLAVLMFGTRAGSLAAVRQACGGLPPFDVRSRWTLRDAQVMLAACGPAGRTAYVQQQLLDLAYPAALAGLLLVVTALLVRPYGHRWWPVLVPAVAMTVLDYVENVGVWTLLLDWPDTHPVVITVAAMATAAKHALGFVAFTMPLLLALIRLATAIRRRVRSAGSAAIAVNADPVGDGGRNARQEGLRPPRPSTRNTTGAKGPRTKPGVLIGRGRTE